MLCFILFWSNVLRRCEISKLKVSDFDYQESVLRVYGKGKGNDDVRVDLNRTVADAIYSWLRCRDSVKPTDPLFIAMDFHNFGCPPSWGWVVCNCEDDLCTRGLVKGCLRTGLDIAVLPKRWIWRRVITGRYSILVDMLTRALFWCMRIIRISTS